MRVTAGCAGDSPLRKPCARSRTSVSFRLAMTCTGTSHGASPPLTAAGG